MRNLLARWGLARPALPPLPGPVPIFVISYNRGRHLERVIASYRALATPVTLVVHDNGSDDPETLATLARLEHTGVAVERRGRIHHPDQLNEVDATVAAFFRRLGRTGPYVVTDCDIDLSIAAPDALAVYHELLCLFPRIECVGPMLRIRDIPRSYPLYNHVMNRHIEQFWRRRPKWSATSRGRVAVLKGVVDTTFALHRAGTPFRRHKRALRVYEPYEALHLDWYESDDPASRAYAAASSGKISHWNNDGQRREKSGVALQYARFRYVEPVAGRLVVKTFELDA